MRDCPDCETPGRGPLLALLDHGDTPERGVAHKTRTGMDVEDDPALRCRICGLAITSDTQRIAVDGRHDHVFFNPHGHVFEIGCFARAPGCGCLGPASTDFSWFPGHSWEVAICAGCQGHLGWRFRREAGQGFFGLILDRLAGSQGRS